MLVRQFLHQPNSDSYCKKFRTTSPKPFPLYHRINIYKNPLQSLQTSNPISHKQHNMVQMDTLPLLLTLAVALLSTYFLWFYFLARTLTGPKVWPIIGSVPELVVNRNRVHDWIASNLRQTGGSPTYQTCTLSLPFFARKQGFFTVTSCPRNIEHILRTRFDNYPKGPHWQAAFHDLLGHGIFNSDGETWLMQRKTAALEFTTRTLRQAMARWVNRTIKNRLWCILDKAAKENVSVDLQDLLLRLTFDNICGLTFGKDPETLSPDLRENPFTVAFDTATEITLQRYTCTAPLLFSMLSSNY